jgi:hypothetical protein
MLVTDDQRGVLGMVTKAYVLEQPPGPSPAKRWVDQRLVPAMINGIAPVEGALNRVSQGSKRNPALALGAALACGYLLRLIFAPARRAPRLADIGPRWTMRRRA